MKKTIFLLLFLVACTTSINTAEHCSEGCCGNSCPMKHEGNPMDDMPCHQMPDGSWMGRCEDMKDTKQEFSIGEPNMEAKKTEFLEVQDGDLIMIEAGIIEKTIAGRIVHMYAYNGMVPGVVISANQGDTITVDFINNLDIDTTIHWHGLRHDIKDDGVPDVSQPPVKPGETYTYTLFFPDTGLYWYHPHIRDDLTQESGLAGLMFVKEEGYWPVVDQEKLLVLDDLLLDNDGLVPFHSEHTTHALMGRYGNTMFINGEEEYKLTVQEGDVVRFFVANVANARPFKLAFDGARMKLVGGDLGAYEYEEFVDSVIIAPAERYVIDIYFDEAGEVEVINDVHENERVLGTISVAESDATSMFELGTHDETIADIDSFREYFDKEADYELELDFRMNNMNDQMMAHMEMMKMEQHEEGIEWEDTMPMMNQHMTSEDVEWIIRDKATGLENMDLQLEASIGDIIKIHIENLDSSAHPMQHPIHLHGQRFLVLSIEGEPVTNMVWKDTVLIPVGEEVEILVDVTNPGEWMMHCHISEHLHSGMMTSLLVKE